MFAVRHHFLTSVKEAKPEVPLKKQSREGRNADQGGLTQFVLAGVGLMFLDEARSDENWSKRLSLREREIAVLVARGLTNKQVGRELHLSDGTVKVHVHNIFLKLGTQSRRRLSYVVLRGNAAV